MDGEQEVADFDQGFDPEEFSANDTDILKLDDDNHTPSATQESDDEQWEAEEAASPIREQENEEDGGSRTLDEELISDGLSVLGRSADGTQQVYLHLTLPGYNLSDISVLLEYEHLQKVELPHNNLADLSALSNMKFLLELDVSHNQLTELLNFEPPKNLRKVDFSFNEITEMTDLSTHHYLTSLVLDNNNISVIKGLENCQRLQNLSLAHNELTQIHGLNNLPIKHLNLGFNHLTKIENLESLEHLESVNLSGNKIRSLDGLQEHNFLSTIDVEENEIIDLSEIQFVTSLPLLRQLNLMRNPIQELPDYRLSVLFHIQKLTELDRKKVDVKEKVAACNLFSPPLEVVAARDHIMHVVYSFLQPSRILESTLPSIETPYPMLVLAGPLGAGKKDLAVKLVEEFSDYFGYGTAHTTRTPQKDEMQGKDYHFVSIDEFEELIKMGKFIQTYSYHGNLYGLTIDAIEEVAREGQACVVNMELEGVLTMKNTHFLPRYVLILPMAAEAHERRLRDKGMYTEAQVEWTLERSEMYAQHNQEHPGFFDMMINSDDITDAYRKLRRLVMDYLGISAPSPSQMSDVYEPSQVGSAVGSHREPPDTMNGSATMGARTWSKPSIADSASQAMNMRQKTMSPMPGSGRGVVEEASLKRRQSAAKEAVAGHRPTLYEQLLSRGPRTVAVMGGGQADGEDSPEDPRSFSAPTHKENMDALPPASPDSSDGGSVSSSSLSNISEARGMDEEENASVGGGGGTPPPQPLPSEKIDPLDLMSSGGSKSLSAGPMAPRGSRPQSQQNPEPETARPLSRSSSRLGSGKHQVLPPIGSSPLPKEPLPAF